MTASTPLRSVSPPPLPAVDPVTDPYASHLLDLLQRSTDRSSWSDELALAAPSWPDSYHLHPARANVLRTLRLPGDAAVLEVGARAGGLTRYLGENAATVDALEVDPALAAVAATRCADLDNVQVRVGWVDIVPDHAAYDLVVAIDVFPEIDAHSGSLESFVTHCRSLMRPGGILVLAADNSQGVSALLGGQAPRPPVPDGCSARLAPSDLVSAVVAAGLEPEVLSAFPDHRHAQLLFSSPRLAELAPDLLAELPKFSVPPAAPTHVEPSSQRQRWTSMVGDGSAGSHANSVVVLAAATAPALDDVATYWSIGRSAAQSACNRIRVQDGRAVVVRTRAFAQAAEPVSPLRLRPHTEPVVQGVTLTRALTHETSLARAREMLVDWRTLVTEWADGHDGTTDVPWDLIPRNVMMLDDGSMCAIDQEWHLDGADANLVLARGWFWLAQDLVTSPSPPAWLPPGTVARTADHLRLLSSATVDPFWLEDFITRESDQAAYVAPQSPRHSHALQSRKNRGALIALSQSGHDHAAPTPPAASSDAESSSALRAVIASLTEENEALRQQVRALELDRRHVALIHRDHVLGLNSELETMRERWGIAQQAARRSREKIARLQRELTAMRESTTWRVGQRVIAPIAKLRGSSTS